MTLSLPGRAHLDSPKKPYRQRVQSTHVPCVIATGEGSSTCTSSQTTGLLTSVAGGDWKRNLSDRSSKALGKCCVLNAVSPQRLTCGRPDRHVTEDLITKGDWIKQALFNHAQSLVGFTIWWNLLEEGAWLERGGLRMCLWRVSFL